MVDVKSVLLCAITMLTGIISQVTMGNMLVWISMAAGVSTLIYNSIRIYKDFKNKQ